MTLVGDWESIGIWNLFSSAGSAMPYIEPSVDLWFYRVGQASPASKLVDQEAIGNEKQRQEIAPAAIGIRKEYF